MKQLFIFISCLAILSSCSNEPRAEEVTVAAEESKRTDLEKLSWLLGNWAAVSPDGGSYERWKKVSDTQYGGIGFAMEKGDTVFFERLMIEQRGADLYYIPSVKDQNNGEPVLFKLTSSAGNTFLFENPQHDFPQKIMYKQVGADSVYAEISGVTNGKEHKESFPMRREK